MLANFFHCRFALILYAPRMPADPFARSEFTRSLVFSLRAYKHHANAHTLGPRAWDPGPKKRARDPGGPSGPRGKGAFGALGGEGAHGALWGYSEAIPNGCYSVGSFCGGAFSKVSFRMKSYLEVRRKQPIWK